MKTRTLFLKKVIWKNENVMEKMEKEEHTEKMFVSKGKIKGRKMQSKSTSESTDQVRQQTLVKQLEQKEKRQKRKRETKDKGIEHIADVLSSAKQKRYLIGIDMSNVSPAMCIIDRNQKTCTCIAFARIQHQTTKTFRDRLSAAIPMKTLEGHEFAFSIHVDPKQQEMEKENENKCRDTVSRNNRVTNHFMSYLNAYNRNDIYVIVEGYSYAKQRHMAGSSSVTGLAEITGVMKCKLDSGGIMFDVVPPTTIKAWFAKKGNANKYEMYTRFHNRQRGVDLDSLFDSNCKGTQNIPSPQQDIVDAFAIAYSLFEQGQGQEDDERKECGTRKKRKTKG